MELTGLLGQDSKKSECRERTARTGQKEKGLLGQESKKEDC
jgi:hypothetical protein